MTFFHLKMSVANLPGNSAPCASMGIAMDHMMVAEGTFSARLAPPVYHTPYVRSSCGLCGCLSSSRRAPSVGVASASSDAQQTFDFDKYFLSELGLYSTDEQFTYKNEAGSEAQLSEVRSIFRDSEREPEFEHGNKGRIPWNKGRKHSAETRELIRQRTIEALRTPQVKSYICHSRRKHSEENKAKISSALRRLWNKRLKRKRLAEKFILQWAENIAEAAKNGGLDEQMLHWSSYSEMEQEIHRHHLQFAMEKKIAKELAKMKLASVAEEKAEKLAVLAQMKKDKEQKAKAKEEEKLEDHRRSIKNTEKPSVNRDLIPKQKFVKIRRKKRINKKMSAGGGAQISSSQIWEKIDSELTERGPKRDSLSDESLEQQHLQFTHSS
ncbi:hypothetical protein LINGRAHAP2_LOCUS32720 [Linum grandiflorum]